MISLRAILYSPFSVAILLLALCFMVYGASLQNEFMIDDYSMILDQKSKGDWQSLLSPVTIKNSADPAAQFIFRPVSNIVRSGLFHLLGEQPFYYHIFNIVLFSVYCFLAYILLCSLSGSASLSLCACLLFCVHPINTIPVNFLTGHEILIFGIFGILSLVLLLRYIETKSKLFLGLSVLSYVLSFLTQEIMIILPMYMVLTLVFIKRYRWKEIVAVLWPYLMLGLIYFLFRMVLNAPKVDQVLQQTPSQISNPLTYLGILIELVLWYIRNLVAPDNIVLMWNINTVSFTAVIKNFLILGGALIGLSFLILHRPKNLNVFALVWFLVGFIPVAFLCLIYPDRGFVIEPHWFFLSSLGFFILLANLLSKVSLMTNAKVTSVILLVLMSGLFFKTQQYHHLWKDQTAYCEYWARLSPQNPSPNFWLGEAYWIEGNYEKAQYFYIRAINGGELDWGIYSNLGMIALEKGNFLLAKNYLMKAQEINPHEALVYSNWGVLYLRQNDLQKAESHFVQALKLEPELIEPRLNLAEIARMTGQMEKAAQLNEEVLAVDPWNTASLYFLIIYAMEAENNYSKAEQLSLKLLQSPRKITGVTLTELGSLFASRNYPKLAGVFYEQALKAQPPYKETYIEFGKLQGNLGHLPEAISIWESGHKLDPLDPRFLEFIEKAKLFQAQASHNQYQSVLK